MTPDRVVLIVTEDAIAHKSLARGLERCGFRVVISSSNVEALQAVSREEPYLAFLDVMASGLDAAAFARHLASSAPNLPIIAMSDDPDLESTARKIGAGACLRVPADLPRVLAKVGPHLPEESYAQSA